MQLPKNFFLAIFLRFFPPKTFKIFSRKIPKKILERCFFQMKKKITEILIKIQQKKRKANGFSKKIFNNEPVFQILQFRTLLIFYEFFFQLEKQLLSIFSKEWRKKHFVSSFQEVEYGAEVRGKSMSLKNHFSICLVLYYPN